MVVHNYCVNLISIILVFCDLSDVLANNITVEIKTKNETHSIISPTFPCGPDITVNVKENTNITINFNSNFVNKVLVSVLLNVVSLFLERNIWAYEVRVPKLVWLDIISADRCTNVEYGKQSNIEVYSAADKKTTTAHFRAVDNNEGLLNCTFLTERNIHRNGTAEVIIWNNNTYRKTYCPVHIAIKYTLQMTIQNIDKNTKSDLKVNGIYYFKDGDSLLIDCIRPEYKGIRLANGATFSMCRRKTETDNCTNLIDNATEARITTELKTDKTNDQDDVICQFKSGIMVKQKLVTRLVLEPDEPPTITINGIAFDESTAPNIYKGLTGEVVKIFCWKNEKNGSLRWDYCKSIKQGCLTKENYYEKEIRYTDLNLTQTLNNTVIKCVFTNVNKRKTITSVLFDIKPEGERHLMLEGETGTSSLWSWLFNDKNSTPPPVQHIPVTTPFTIDPKVPSEDGNITLNLTKHVFSFNEVLNFSCSICYDNSSIFINITTPDSNGTKINNGQNNENNELNKKKCRIYELKKKKCRICEVSYKMNFKTESVQIFCVAKKSGEVVGHDNVKLMRVEPTKTDTSATENGSTTDAKGNDMFEKVNSDQQSDDSIQDYIWVIVGVGILLILIFITITVKVCKSKKSDQEKDHEDVTYENLSNEVVSPFPKNARLEETYLKPADARVTDNVTYAQPYIETNIENLYSKPLPKSQRNHTPQYSEVIPKNMQTNEPTYAEIESFSNNDRKQITNKTDNATIQDLNPNYTNVFVNEPYVNTKNTVRNDDYAEPSYCEIGKLIED